MDIADSSAGDHAFPHSPFRSVSFLITTALCLLCVVYDLWLLVRHWAQLSHPAQLTLWMTAFGIAASWKRVFNYYQRIGIAYRSCRNQDEARSLEKEFVPSTKALNDALFYSLSAVLLLLVYIGHLV